MWLCDVILDSNYETYLLILIEDADGIIYKWNMFILKLGPLLWLNTIEYSKWLIWHNSDTDLY